ncbi:hypothetical protein KP78_23420 [Jeotgalibacillus soli]|uniref:DUF881 domain-containing protein n=1 Tax=Jeotgalibacillus soli TaxID=889306 RepID=A0A0C2VLB8_9BACL|nr:hypothetical protein KP78_23420 [Jeotgalibacillus soli]
MAGFLLSFSYSITKDELENGEVSSSSGSRYGAQEERLRKELLDKQQENIALQDRLYEQQDIVREYEKSMSSEEQAFFNLAEDAENYRMFLGKIAVEGPGLSVQLEDGKYDPASGNVNDYIVHEHHVFNVMNELFIAGASAISINGQRIKHNSYIVCTGPVIMVDGVQYPAPFTITAIGDSDVLAAALNLTGGVRDQLVNDHIVFTLEKIPNIKMNPVIADS